MNHKLLILLLLFNLNSQAGNENSHDHDEADLKQVQISPEMAKQVAIKTAKTTSGIINHYQTVYGRTVNDPSQLSHIRARFAGIITAVKVNIGDTVKAGDILAYVESNDSLKRYAIKALTDGVVITRHANPGEQALEQVLFSIANFSVIWAELQVFPSQKATIKVGQKVLIESTDKQISSTIKYIIPASNQQPYVVAGVPIDNHDLSWTTGMLVAGKVLIKQKAVALMVKNQAIQKLDGKPVVFIKTNNDYQAKTVQLGLTDDINSEILTGLPLNVDYVVKNSYLIKADIEKSGASHDH